MKFSTKIVVLVLILNIVFTAAVLIIFAKTASEPSALITAWFAFTTGELWMLASIKKTKVKQDNTTKEEDNGDYCFNSNLFHCNLPSIFVFYILYKKYSR